MDRRVFIRKFSLTALGTAALPMALSAKDNKMWGKKITPQSLLEQGKLHVDLPEEAFDPKSNWTQTWRLWLPFRGKVGEDSGYIRVQRNVGNSKEKVSFNVEQAISENKHWAHFTKASIKAKNNKYGTPISWEAASEYVKAPKKGFDKNVGLYQQSSSLSQKEEVCLDFTLIDTVQRMKVEGKRSLNFTLIDELSKEKKNHQLRYLKDTSIRFEDRSVEVSCYEQIGEGMLPWCYYVDHNGRLLLAISGMKVLIADTGARKKYLDLYPVISTISIDDRAAAAQRVPQKRSSKKPNILFLSTDQQTWNSISALNNKYVHTPHLDRLASRGVTFTQCYSPNPICSPTRASWITGLTTSEHGVIKNGQSIIPGLKSVGHHLREQGYETVFAGKLHVGIPKSYGEKIPGFDKVLCMGIGGKGTLGDQVVSNVAAGYLQNRDRSKPFYLTVNFLQPHDICNWIKRHHNNKDDRHLESVRDQLPPLPDNFDALLAEPKKMKVPRQSHWKEIDWRYYLWAYYRMVEEVDAEIGRVLHALDESGETDNTVILFNADHGEGTAHHQSVTKNYLYDEATKVPLIISYPKELPTGVVDTNHLMSCLDIVPTVCDFASCSDNGEFTGDSFRSLTAGKTKNWRDFVVSEVSNDAGRMVRSERYKLIVFRNDSNLMFFDMKNDAGETVNLAKDPKYKKLIQEHLLMLQEWESKLKKAPACKPFMASSYVG